MQSESQLTISLCPHTHYTYTHTRTQRILFTDHTTPQVQETAVIAEVACSADPVAQISPSTLELT